MELCVVVWWDQSLECFSHKTGRYVWYRKSIALDQMSTIPVVKQGDGMLWGSFTSAGSDASIRVVGIILLRTRDEEEWQQPIETLKITKGMASPEIKIKVLEWPSQSPDLNPVFNLGDLNRTVHRRCPGNLTELGYFCNGERQNIATYCKMSINYTCSSCECRH